MNKPGYQTTEFWVSAAPAIAAITDENGKHQDLLIVSAGILCALYIISRTVVKWKETK